MMSPDAEAVARMLDHALLQPTLTDAQMRDELLSLRPYPLASVCIKPYAVPLACEILEDTTIAVGTVLGFPHGSARPAVKAFEAAQAFAEGAVEVDMVVNIGKVLGEDWAFVRDDIGAVLAAARAHNGLLKVIFETALLPDDQVKIALCEICTELDVDFVKTSTGFSSAGATAHDVALMRRHCGPKVGIKASGGVRTLGDAQRFIALGATRLGTSSTHAILASGSSTSDY